MNASLLMMMMMMMMNGQFINTNKGYIEQKKREKEETETTMQAGQGAGHRSGGVHM